VATLRHKSANQTGPQRIMAASLAISGAALSSPPPAMEGALQSYSIKAWYAEKFFSSSWTARSNSLRAFLASDRAENMEA